MRRILDIPAAWLGYQRIPKVAYYPDTVIPILARNLSFDEVSRPRSMPRPYLHMLPSVEKYIRRKYMAGFEVVVDGEPVQINAALRYADALLNNRDFAIRHLTFERSGNR